MIELETPQIEPVEEVGTYAKYEGPCRRQASPSHARGACCLSSRGAAVTASDPRVYQEVRRSPCVKKTSPRSSERQELPS